MKKTIALLVILGTFAMAGTQMLRSGVPVFKDSSFGKTRGDASYKARNKAIEKCASHSLRARIVGPMCSIYDDSPYNKDFRWSCDVAFQCE